MNNVINFFQENPNSTVKEAIASFEDEKATRKEISAALAAGTLVVTGKRAQVGEDGSPKRGRPSNLISVAG